MNMANLDALFRPRHIAIIGASNRPLTIGHRIMTNLKRYGFRGNVFPVNPKGDIILDTPSYPSIRDVPGDIDLVHIIVKNTLVPQTLEDCAEKGVRVAIINTSGFKETGPEGAEMENELVKIGKRTGLRLFGPNCQGVMNSDPAVSLYSNFTFADMNPGHVSIVAQGGGVAEVINNYFGMNRVGQRMYASNGNACDISVPEIIEYYGQDEQTHVIVLHAESFPDPAEFLERVRPVAQKKPVLALKSGITAEGARAVSSHTGGLMQQDTVTDVLFDKCGVLRFANLLELCETAQAFATQPVPAGNRIGMVTNAGSPAIIVTDEAVKAGMEVPVLGEASRNFLKDKLQAIASVANPIDMMATAAGDEYRISLQALTKDPGIDALVVCFMTPFFVDTLEIARAIKQVASESDRTMIAVAMTNPDEKAEWRQTVDLVREAGVPVYHFPESAARVLFHMDRYRKLRDRRQEPVPGFGVDAEKVSRLIRDSRPGDDGFLSPKDTGLFLSAYGIPLVEERRCRDWNALKAAAFELGFPVVLKGEAPALIHKTDAGAVILHIADEKSLEQAFKDIKDRLSGSKDIGFLLQSQLEQGVEVIVGGSRVPGLGSMVMFGLGGIHVEVFKDVVFRLNPLDMNDAREMVSGIKGSQLLDGFRGQPGVDRQGIMDIILRVSRLLADHPEISELDLNPVIAYPPGQQPRVVDVRIKINSKSGEA
jgi:acyl-CoA synthetase (NDP forming)